MLCSLGTLADQANATVTIKVTPQAPGTLTNNANVLGIIVDPDTADNGASADTTVNPAADLSLTKSDSPDPVAAGELLTYTLGVHNAGPQDATGTTVTDTLPAGVAVRVGHAHAGQLLRGERHRHLRARDRCERRGRERRGQGAPAGGRPDHQPGRGQLEWHG